MHGILSLQKKIMEGEGLVGLGTTVDAVLLALSLISQNSKSETRLWCLCFVWSGGGQLPEASTGAMGWTQDRLRTIKETVISRPQWQTAVVVWELLWSPGGACRSHCTFAPITVNACWWDAGKWGLPSVAVSPLISFPCYIICNCVWWVSVSYGVPNTQSHRKAHRREANACSPNTWDWSHSGLDGEFRSI